MIFFKDAALACSETVDDNYSFRGSTTSPENEGGGSIGSAGSWGSALGIGLSSALNGDILTSAVEARMVTHTVGLVVPVLGVGTNDNGPVGRRRR